MQELRSITQNKKGVSLLETLFSVSITLVMAASFYQLLSSFYRNYEVQEAIAETQQQGRVTVDLFWQEIRNTGLDPSGTLFNPGKRTKSRTVRQDDGTCDKKTRPTERIFEASPTTFHFLADLDGNGQVNGTDNEEHIRYEWVDSSGISNCWTKKEKDPRPNTLYRDSGGTIGMVEVATNIVAFNLSYYDEDGNQLEIKELPGVLRKTIRRVVLELTTEKTNLSTNEPVRRSISTDIWLRNM